MPIKLRFFNIKLHTNVYLYPFYWRINADAFQIDIGPLTVLI